MRSLLLTTLLLGALASAAETPARVLAVSYFDINATDPELQVLKKGMADMVMSDMANVQGLRVVEREKLNEILAELKLAKSPFIDPRQAVKLGKGLSATHLLTGAITVVDKTMRLEARLIDVQTGESIGSRKVEGAREEFFALEKELVDLLIEALTLKPTLKEKAALRKSQTESYPAFKSYSMGLDRSDRKDDQGARQAFDEARKADPNYAAVKAALDHLGRAVKGIEDQRAQSLDEKLKALTADDPDLYKKIERLSTAEGGPDDREAAQMAVFEFVVRSGLRPAKARSPRKEIGESTLDFWEMDNRSSLVGVWSTDDQTVRSASVVLEYMVRKYPDDPTELARLDNEVAQIEKKLASIDLTAPVPDYEGRGEWTDRHRTHAAFLARLAAVVQLPKGLSRDPRACVARVKELLAKEHQRRIAELNAEFSRRVASIDPKNEKAMTEEIGDLSYIAQESRDITRDQADAARKKLMVSQWLLKHPEVKPHHGTDKDPIYLEESMLTQWIGRYSDDPESWALIPPVGEYLLKRFPDSKYLTSQLKLYQRSIEEKQLELEMSKREWARKSTHEPEYGAAPEVRAFFKQVADVNRKLK